MTITHVVGDLFTSGETHIAHGCNTKGFMGAGVARIVAERIPIANATYGAEVKAGNYRIGSICPVYSFDHEVTVFNLATQVNPGADASYWAIMLAFGNLFEYCAQRSIKRVAIPRIGCGIGGLKWSKVEWIINGIYEYQPDGPEIVVYTHPSDQFKVWD